MDLSMLPVKPGRFLGAGAFKRAYEVKGSADLVVLIQDDRYCDVEECIEFAKQEKRDLAKLRKMGFPAAEILQIGFLKRKGKLVVAHTMKRYSYGTVSAANVQTLLSERTINTCRFILAKLAEHQPFEIEDLQFLFSPDGSFVIADPLCLSHKKTSTCHTILYDLINDTAKIIRKKNRRKALRKKNK